MMGSLLALCVGAWSSRTQEVATDLPIPSEISKSIAMVRRSAAPVPLPGQGAVISPSVLATTAFAQRLLASPVKQTPLAYWRTLFLVYRNTDTDYRTAAGEERRFKGGMSDEQVGSLVTAIGAYPKLVENYTNGIVKMDATVRIVNRAVSLRQYGAPGAVYFPHPSWENECLSEKRQYFDPSPYDAVVIVHYPGEVPQGLGGSGGFFGGAAVQNIPYSTAQNWSARNPNSMSTVIHEWIHGLDSFFGNLGYRNFGLHHLARYKDGVSSGYGHSDALYTLLLTGRSLGFDESRYGFSRAVWMAGRPSLPRVQNPPVQLLAPLPGVSLANNSRILFRWNPDTAPEKRRFRVLLYDLDKYDKPLKILETSQDRKLVDASSLTAGNYLWTVQSLQGGKWSQVGDSHYFKIVPTSTYKAPILNVRIPLATQLPAGDYSTVISVSCVAESTSFAGVEIKYLDGVTEVQSLSRRTPGETDCVWTGPLVFRPTAEQSQATCTLLHIDEGGLESRLALGSIRYQGSPNMEKETIRRTRPLNTNRLLEGGSNAGIPNQEFREIPAQGGNYPLAVLMDSVHEAGGGAGRKCYFVDVSGKGQPSFRVPMDRWLEFNGMIYGIHRFAPNESGETLLWQFRVISQRANGEVDVSRMFSVYQRSAKDQ